MRAGKVCFLSFALCLAACTTARNATPASANFLQSTYGYDAAFLKQHTDTVLELQSADGKSKVLLSADYQGRVMTSTATGDSGRSFGWLNYDLLAATAKRKNFNPVGGEERFWLGPEGGQYALYFTSGDSFTIANWQVPPVIDTESFSIAHATRTEVVFTKTASLVNYSGARFDVAIKRTIRLLDKNGIEAALQAAVPAGVQFVGYQSENRLQNSGTAEWRPETGLPSVWLLGMFTPTPQTRVFIPFRPGPNARRSITDSYFGTVPAERLQVKDSVLYFTCDGRYRSKIGVSPEVAKPFAASFDFNANVLTIVLPQVVPNRSYVNSKWEQQADPYRGDVINAYNDGPLADGTQMGPFYEIESSSPALQLRPGQGETYTQTTLHLQGPYVALRQLALTLAAVDLNDLKP